MNTNIDYEKILDKETLTLFLNNYCYTTNEVAEICNVNRRTVIRWVHRGKIKPIVINGCFLFFDMDIEKQLKQTKKIH